MSKKGFVIITITSLGVLLIPLIAMNYSEEVNWSLLDFVLAFLLLFAAGFFIDVLVTRTKKHWVKVLAIFGIVLLILFWLELAVGVFGTPLAGS